MAQPSRLNRLVLPGLLLAAALAALRVWSMLDRGSPTPSLPRHLVEAAAWAAAAFLLTRLLDVFLWHGLVARRGGRPPPRLLVDLCAALIWITTAGIVAAAVFDLPVAGIVTTSGVAVAILGFALRDMLASLFSGVAINVERPYQIGDWIEIGSGPAAQVVEVGWLTTRAVTRDGVGVVVPNAQLASQAFRNYSRPRRSYRETLPVTLDHDAAPDRVERLLLAAAAEVAAVGPPLPAPDVRIAEFGPRGIVWQLRYWLADYADGPEVRYQVQRAVLRHLHQAGLSLPYGKLDLYHAEMPPRHVEPGRADQTLLARCGIFEALDPADLVHLAAGARRHHLAQGAVLLRQGEPGQSLFIVIEGVLEVWHERDDGNRRWLGALGPGAALGEFSLLTGERRSATVTVKRDAVLLEIGREALAPVLERRPDLVAALGRTLAERQARTEAATATSTRPQPLEGHEESLGQRIRAFFGL